MPGKSDLLVLDFVGNAGRHDIVCASDILGGKISDQDRAAAQAQIEKSTLPMSLDDALAAAREQEERERADRLAADKRRGITAEVIYEVADASPWDMFAVRRDYLHERYGYDPATDKQLAALRKMLGDKNVPEKLGKLEASRMMGALVARIETDRASYKQIKLLAKHGFDAREWEFGAASKAIDTIASNGWRVPPWLRAQLAEREPGEEG